MSTAERKPDNSTGKLTGDAATEKLVNLYTDPEEVYVGECRSAFLVHRHILCTSSIFFQTAFNKDWRESFTRCIRLREVTPSAFAIYLHRLYTGKLDIVQDQSNEGTRSLDTYTTLLDCYVLGDFLGDSRFCNAVTDEMIWYSKLSKYLPNERLIQKYWPRLGAANSGMRRLLLELVAHFGRKRDVERYPDEFKLKILGLLLDQRRLAFWRRGSRAQGGCYYHDHYGSTDCHDPGDVDSWLRGPPNPRIVSRNYDISDRFMLIDVD